MTAEFSNGPPTTPALARNSSMTAELNRFKRPGSASTSACLGMGGTLESMTDRLLPLICLPMTFLVEVVRAVEVLHQVAVDRGRIVRRIVGAGAARQALDRRGRHRAVEE